ncbi:MAG: hypothetical protein D6701_05080 [Gemmatimonadetes bacterium]|nr:MAG: hypothetical protein D6701_05080 [Gemmatimonadota bacterium]
MKRIIGLLIAVGIGTLASIAFRTSSEGWAAGHSDVGFWWAVIGSLLSIAALGAAIGTWLHTRPSGR